MRKTPNALNTREQGKEGKEGEVGKEVGRDGGRKGQKERGEEGREVGRGQLNIIVIRAIRTPRVIYITLSL